MLERTELQHNGHGKLFGRKIHSSLSISTNHHHGQLSVLLYQIVSACFAITRSIMTGNPLVLPIYRLSHEECVVCFRLERIDWCEKRRKTTSYFINQQNKIWTAMLSNILWSWHDQPTSLPHLPCHIRLLNPNQNNERMPFVLSQIPSISGVLPLECPPLRSTKIYPFFGTYVPTP